MGSAICALSLRACFHTLPSWPPPHETLLRGGSLPKQRSDWRTDAWARFNRLSVWAATRRRGPIQRIRFTCFGIWAQIMAISRAWLDHGCHSTKRNTTSRICPNCLGLSRSSEFSPAQTDGPLRVRRCAENSRVSRGDREQRGTKQTRSTRMRHCGA